MTDIDLIQYPTTVAAFDGNEQRAKVFLDRYARKDENGVRVERTPDEMWHRVAAAIADDTPEGRGFTDGHQPKRFLDLLKDFKFVPGGRILAGAGTGHDVTYYNCYVIPVETEYTREFRQGKLDERKLDVGNDSRRAIFDTIGRMVDIMSRGGGVGINWSVLRPKGAYLKSVNGTSSGPVGWMDVASKAVGEVEQGGSRRGAAMFMIDDWHPDVLQFIDAKRDLTRITNANVSVSISDAFMTAVMADADWGFIFPDTAHPAYDAEWDGDIDAWSDKYPDAIKDYGRVPARDIWRKLAQAAWDNGEPGVVFLDRYNKLSTGMGVERIISVNPCGEQGLGAYSVCNLGAMNLDAYIRDEAGYSPSGKSFDWRAFAEDVETAVEFLDNVIDKNHYFIPENEQAQKDLRRIGLGVMGLADALIGLGLRYGSKNAVDFTDRVFSTMKLHAVAKSTELAAAKGAAPAWRREMANRPYFKEFAGTNLGHSLREVGLRNLFLLTQAPTGTTSILAGVNSGIEPYFAFKYTRKDRTGTHEVLAPAVAKYHQPGLIHGPEFVTAAEVTVEEHIAMQAAAQRHIDSSVSKTINAPNSHTVEDVENAYMLAFKQGLKGLAYFRDGCGRAQVLYREDPNEKVAKLESEVEALRAEAQAAKAAAWDEKHPKKLRRPPALSGRTWKERTNVGSAYVTVNRNDGGEPIEVFVNVGKAGSDVMVMGEALGRVISLALKSGAELDRIAQQLSGVGGLGKFAPSIPNAIAVTLLEDQTTADEEKGGGYVEETAVATAPAMELPVNGSMAQDKTGQLCAECQSFSVVLEEGCSKCQLCGWSAC